MNTYFLWDDSGKKDLAIVKHYLMKHVDKKTWDNMRSNYKKWKPDGLSAAMFKTIVSMHYHFTKMEGAMIDDHIDDTQKILLRHHHRAIRDYYEEDIEYLEKENDRLKEETDMMLIEDHKYELKIQAQGYDAQLSDLQYENQKLKQQIQFQIEKRQSQDKIAAHREAHLNQELNKLLVLPKTPDI
jgi:septal ring factor EnvC (AmiA/AmiB activator)